MASRITRMTITVMSIGGVFLVGLLICCLNGRVNAQRINPTLEDRPSTPLPIVSSPPEPARWDSQPFGISSGALTQPIVVAIKGGPALRGEPVNLGALQVKTIFGAVSIPVDRIVGVRTADDSGQPATICLTNGDSITGVLSADSITIKTEWGTATIDRGHIVSIVTSTDPVNWQQHEGRWIIVPVTPVAPATETIDTDKPVGELRDGAALPQVPPITPATVSPSESDPTRVAPLSNN